MKPSSRSPGFTLIEMIAVITIIILLAGIVVGSMGYVQGRQAREKAKAQIAFLSKAIEEYKMDMGAYPGDDLPDPPGGNYGGDSADTVEGEHSKVLYATLFYEGWAFAEKDEAEQYTARKIYLPLLDPRENKQGWVDKVAANATVTEELEIKDPWGHPYRYRRGKDARNPDFDLWSVGKDGKTNATEVKHADNRDDIW